MSFWSSLFGKNGKDEAEAEVVHHEGFMIRPKPMKDGEQFRVCGEISKTIANEEKVHTFIRADVYPDKNSATEATIMKAKRIIAEQGERIFNR